MHVAPLCTGMSRKRNEKLSQSAVIKHFAKTRNSKEFLCTISYSLNSQLTSKYSDTFSVQSKLIQATRVAHYLLIKDSSIDL